jgi:molybdopterin synthase sulfur carrier subunit
LRKKRSGPDEVNDMRVEVRLFGNLGSHLSEGSNRSSFTKVLERDTTVREVVTELNIPGDIYFIVVVNGMRVNPDYMLKDGDQVNLFRPTGGG